METFYTENIHLFCKDDHNNDQVDTKIQKDILQEAYRLTPDLMKLPLKRQSVLLKDCLINKLDHDNLQVWKLFNPQNFWFIISSIYNQPSDYLLLKSSPKALRQQFTLLPSKGNRKQYKFVYLNSQKSDIQDQVFVCESRMLAMNKHMETNISIDEVLSLWENQLVKTGDFLDMSIAKIYGQMEEQKREQQYLNRLLFPTLYKTDLVGYQHMQFEDLEAQRCFQQILRIKNTTTVCCVCNLQKLDDCKFLFCLKCKSFIHDKCYVIANQIIDSNQFVCWSCSNPNDKYYNGQKCCLCNVQGGVMGSCELMSTNNFVNKKYHPETIFELQIQENKNQFVIHKKRNTAQNLIDFNTRVHLSCAFWHQQCYYNRKTEQFEGLTTIKDKKWKNPCKICEQYNGAVIQCCDNGCSKVYHVECARKSDIYMSLLKIGKLNKQILCQKHRIKYSYEKIVQKRYQKNREIKKLFMGIQRIIGVQGFIQKKPKKKQLKVQKIIRKQLEKQSQQSKYTIIRKNYSEISTIQHQKNNR